MGRPPSKELYGFDRFLPWLRGRDEEDMAFRAFTIYRNLGSMGRHRSMNELNSIMRGDKKYDPKKKVFNRSTMEWSKLYHWEARVIAWDNRIQKVKDSVIISDAKKWERRRIASILRNWKTVKELRIKVEQMLKFPVFETRESRDGKLQVTRPMKWSISDIAPMLRTVIELENAIFEAVSKPDEEMTEMEKRVVAEVQFEAELRKAENAKYQDEIFENATETPQGEGESAPDEPGKSGEGNGVQSRP